MDYLHTVCVMIMWLNGTFGAGKSTTAGLIEQRLADFRIFDPEHMGYMVAANFGDLNVIDFQDLPPWRQLVPRALKSVEDFAEANVIAPQTVLVQDYWNEMHTLMIDLGLDVQHVLLDCGEQALHDRIQSDKDQGPSAWRHDHVPRYFTARPWLLAAADLVVDTTSRAPTDVVETIVQSLGLDVATLD